MKLTKRSFLQGLAGSIFAPKIIQAKEEAFYNQSKRLMEIGTPGPIRQAVPEAEQALSVDFFPTCGSLERISSKRNFLSNTDPARGRSGQFTSHAQKKERWIQKKEYRRFMAGPWYRPKVETIHQWKPTTLLEELNELKAMLPPLS